MRDLFPKESAGLQLLARYAANFDWTERRYYVTIPLLI
jgi:hypothetical protein